MQKGYGLGTEDLKAFEIQKKIVIPIFEDVPMLIVQILMFNVLDTEGFLDDSI